MYSAPNLDSHLENTTVTETKKVCTTSQKNSKTERITRMTTTCSKHVYFEGEDPTLNLKLKQQPATGFVPPNGWSDYDLMANEELEYLRENDFSYGQLQVRLDGIMRKRDRSSQVQNKHSQRRFDAQIRALHFFIYKRWTQPKRPGFNA
ncbi:MAG: hypothetical protein ACTSUE_09010 [Promethearchaeota archaeon]